jgi:D-ribose pyranase
LLRGNEILHAELLRALADLRHGQKLVVADAGLPGSTGTTVDLGLTAGVPSFAETLDLVVRHGAFEAALLAQETRAQPHHAQVVESLEEIPLEYLEHKRLVELAASAEVFVRTGECTPYANVVLVAGTSFAHPPDHDRSSGIDVPPERT